MRGKGNIFHLILNHVSSEYSNQTKFEYCRREIEKYTLQNLDSSWKKITFFLKIKLLFLDYRVILLSSIK